MEEDRMLLCNCVNASVTGNSRKRNIFRKKFSIFGDSVFPKRSTILKSMMMRMMMIQLFSNSNYTLLIFIVKTRQCTMQKADNTKSQKCMR